MQYKSKAMKSIWLTYCGGVAGHLQFQGAKKRPAKVQEMNALVASVVSEVLKQKNRTKDTAAHNSVSEDE